MFLNLKAIGIADSDTELTFNPLLSQYTWDHSFSAYTNFPEKLTFLTP